MRKILLIILCTFCTLGFSQKIKLSPLSEISVITCGSGSELYSTFGHSAIRVQDPTLSIDAVYNYGMFDFTTPNFLLKFIRGKLDYTLARQSYPYFLLGYEEENRWVKGQVLDLTLDERQTVFDFLENNYLPQNRDYKYDFFYNNCATKIWDVLKEVYGNQLEFDQNYLDELYTHRQLIRQKVPVNSWLGFGIDLALGSVIDDVASPKEHMFLPDYLMQQLIGSKLNSKPLTKEPETLYAAKPEVGSGSFFLSPAFWLLFLLIAVLIMTYFDFKNNTRRRWLDFSLFFITGLAGSLIIFLWFFTDHTATAGNFNLLWTLPINLIVAFVVAQKKGPNWVAKYAVFSLILLLVGSILWLLNVQVFSPLLIIVWITLAVRYSFLYWSYQTPKLL